MTERTVEMHHQFQSVIICVGIMSERTVEMHHQFHSVIPTGVYNTSF
jgi:hypothetical protein